MPAKAHTKKATTPAKARQWQCDFASAEVLARLPDFFHRERGDQIPSDLIGAKVIHFGAAPSGCDLEGGGLIIDYIPDNSSYTHRLVLAFNELGMWVVSHIRGGEMTTVYDYPLVRTRLWMGYEFEERRGKDPETGVDTVVIWHEPSQQHIDLTGTHRRELNTACDMLVRAIRHKDGLDPL